jgi:thiamine biosynthesis protein ThiS
MCGRGYNPVMSTQQPITVNGESRAIAEPMTVTQLVSEMKLAGRAVAVEVNEKLVPRKLHDQTTLHPGDRVEVVTLVGGG